ncbi:MAG: hypothetical protein Q8912_00085 [Bacillota bacterium]|nr:hypothetical protein [Bacillota bacterium]MDP4158413.1 hypothetical protein [Bacillota bacterium]
MLAWILILMISIFLVSCATVIATSCYQLVKLVRRIPEKRGPLARSVEV